MVHTIEEIDAMNVTWQNSDTEGAMTAQEVPAVIGQKTAGRWRTQPMEQRVQPWKESQEVSSPQTEKLPLDLPRSSGQIGTVDSVSENHAMKHGNAKRHFAPTEST
jgi:hypothetical protein